MSYIWDRIYEGPHASYVESVPFKYIMTFTLFQLVYFLLCYGITWIPIGGILFPLPFFLLIPIREHFLPKMLPHRHLQELDASAYEEYDGHVGFNKSLSRRVCYYISDVIYIFFLKCQLYFFSVNLGSFSHIYNFKS